MRKIEKDMLRAIETKENLSKSNTVVYVIADGLSANIRLHGNLIATVFYEDDKPNAIKIFDGGWKSKTTKSRLNALLSWVNICVSQKGDFWYLIDENGNKTEFVNGASFKI